MLSYFWLIEILLMAQTMIFKVKRGPSVGCSMSVYHCVPGHLLMLYDNVTLQLHRPLYVPENKALLAAMTPLFEAPF